jgi:hypothetical protein
MTVAACPIPILQFFNNLGQPNVGGSILTQVGGVNAVTYQDPAGAIPLPNPIPLNSRGEVSNAVGTSCQLFLTVGIVYTFTQYDKNGNQLNQASYVNQIPTLDSTTFKYDQTAPELANSVTPVNYSYGTQPVADVARYGVVGDGSTDDTAALQLGLNVASTLGLALLIPSGLKVKITSYVQIPSNTTLWILGTLQLTNRASGLYANGASNISIQGYKIGTITDSTVAAGYTWNTGATIDPAIHLRSVTNALVDGLNFTYVNQGILISNATTNTATGAAWTLTQAPPVNVTVSNCSMTFTEFSGLSCYSGQFVKYIGNYSYRNGDGGIWMMGSIDCAVLNNTRISPYANPASVATNGTNNPAFTNTWNDEQGMEFENCFNLTIRGNVVKGFWAQGIDIKNECNWVDVIDNRVSDCENASIIVRDGDAVKGACGMIKISHNTVINHGTQHFNQSTSLQGAYYVSSCYDTEVTGNVLYGYQCTGTTQGVGFALLGPGAYMGSNYPSNPHQASLKCSGNSVRFGVGAEEAFVVFAFATTTLSAFVINGYYDAIECDSNDVSTDAYGATDRINTNPVIQLTYNVANSTSYPRAVSVSGNTISNWSGINVTGLFAITYSGLKCNSNVFGSPKGAAISASYTHYATFSGNVGTQVGSGSGQPAMSLAGSSGSVLLGVIATGNSFTGRFDGGASAMTYGISVNFVSGIDLSHNRVANVGTGSVQIQNQSGDVICQNTSGFPRSQAGSPNGGITSYWYGEDFFDTAGHWWRATTFNSTVWTQLS